MASHATLGRMISGLSLDARYLVRTARGRPLATVLTVVSLAISIALAAVVFALLNAFYVAPLPHLDDPSLRHIALQHQQVAWAPDRGLTGSAAEMLVARLPELQATATWRFDDWAPLVGTGHRRPVERYQVSTGFFALVGVRPAAGRLLGDGDRGANVAVISHAIWQNRFGSDPGLIGQDLRHGGRSLTVVGVAPRHFDYPAGAGLWEPIGPAAAPDSACCFQVLARLRAGSDESLLGARLAAIGAGQLDGDEPYALTSRPLRSSLVPTSLWQGTSGVLTLVFLVFGMAIISVSAMALIRWLSAAPELATRAALGAPRYRIVRLVLLEAAGSLAVGTGLGLGLGLWLQSLYRTGIGAEVPVIMQLRLDVSVALLVAAGVGAIGLPIAIVPALRASGRRLLPGLQQLTTGLPGGRGARRWLLVLSATQMALCLGLTLFTAQLVWQWLRPLESTVGFPVDGLVTIDLPVSVGDTASVASGTLVDDLAQSGLVDDVGISTALGSVPDARLIRDGSDGATAIPSRGLRMLEVSERYLPALGMRVLRGRVSVSRSEALERNRVVLGQALSRRLFGPEDPVGRSVTITDGASPVGYAVLGVVDDVRDQPLFQHVAPPTLYLLGDPPPTAPRVAIVRLRRPVDRATLDRLATIAQTAAPDRYVTVTPTRSRLRSQLGGARAGAYAGLLISVLALSLVGLGVHATVVDVLRRRGHECAVRRCLGAPRRSLLATLARDVLVAVAGAVPAGFLGYRALIHIAPLSSVGVAEVSAPATALATLCFAALTLTAAIGPLSRSVAGELAHLLQRGR